MKFVCFCYTAMTRSIINQVCTLTWITELAINEDCMIVSMNVHFHLIQIVFLARRKIKWQSKYVITIQIKWLILHLVTTCKLLLFLVYTWFNGIVSLVIATCGHLLVIIVQVFDIQLFRNRGCCRIRYHVDIYWSLFDFYADRRWSGAVWVAVAAVGAAADMSMSIFHSDSAVLIENHFSWYCNDCMNLHCFRLDRYNCS